MWDLPQRKCIRTIQAHDGCVRGITFNQSGTHLLSIGDDKTIKIWDVDIEYKEEDNISTVISKVGIIVIIFKLVICRKCLHTKTGNGCRIFQKQFIVSSRGVERHWHHGVLCSCLGVVTSIFCLLVLS